MPYHVAICDDSVNDAEFVKTILLSWANERMHEVRADVFPSAESFMFEYDENKRYGGWDAIINSKVSLARSRDIDVSIDAHIPIKLKMSELDLCCILGNLFDNAIEASMPLPKEKRLIRVYMDMKGTQLYISFTNFTSTKKLTKLGNSFATTKGEGHGFGLVRIDNIVDRLDGYLSRNSEDGAFTTEILIPQV